MKNQTISPIVLEIVADMRNTRNKNCDMWESEGNDIVHEDWIHAMRSITVEEDIKDVIEVISWSSNTGRMIQSLDDYKAYTLWEVYYDLHKDVHGVKARHTNWFDHDAKGWDEAIRDLNH